MRYLFLFFVLFQPYVFSYTPGKTYSITVLHTNDHHGNFWKNNKGEFGLAARFTLIQKLKSEIQAQGGFVLVLDAGDVNTGTPESEMTNAEPDFRGMSLIGYDAMAIGNHEFDKPFDVLLKQQNEWSNFPFISANIYKKNKNERYFLPYIIKNNEDLKIAIFGLTTDQTPEQSIRFPKVELEMKSPITEAETLVPELKKLSDVIIALTHIGHYPNEQHGSRSPGDVTLARKVNGIDLIVGGHTQKPLFEVDVQNGATIVQSGEWGKHLGRVDLEFKDGVVRLVKYELIPVNLKQENGKKTDAILENQKMAALLEPFKKSVEKLTNEKVGTLKGKFEGHRSVIRVQETNLGNFVTYLMAQSTGSTLAVTDSGVIRNSLEEGDIQFGDILSVHPASFGLKYASVILTGKELWDYLEAIAFKTDGAFPQFYGIKIKVSEKDKKLIEVDLKNGIGVFEPLSLTENYKMALSDFIANGGDGYPLLNHHKTYRVLDVLDSEIMKNYFLQNKEVIADHFKPIGNRVVVE